jgi:hypothetical protein
VIKKLLQTLRTLLVRSPEPQIPKTQGVGTWRLAEQYLKAAAALNPGTSANSFVSYFLYGHGLELTLKAFLVSQGSTNKRLKRIGHDLRRALRAASKHPSFSKVRMSDKDSTVISWLSAYYRDKEFEYLVTGYKSFPALTEVRDVCDRLHKDLKPLIWEAVHAHLAEGAA